MEAPMSTARRLRILAAALALPLVLRADVDAPHVKKLGKTVAQYKDDTVKLVVGYKYAQTHLNAKWIFFDVYVSAEGSAPIEIDREDVAFYMPDGKRLNLPGQKRMAEGIPNLQWILKEAAIMADPIGGYFTGRTQEDRLPFFTIPGRNVVQDRFSANQQILVYGNLYFEAPGDRFDPGIYTLAIKNKTVDIKLPLALGIEGELERTK
jgi:hypothetical protein